MRFMYTLLIQVNTGGGGTAAAAANADDGDTDTYSTWLFVMCRLWYLNSYLDKELEYITVGSSQFWKK